MHGLLGRHATLSIWRHGYFPACTEGGIDYCHANVVVSKAGIRSLGMLSMQILLDETLCKQRLVCQTLQHQWQPNRSIIRVILIQLICFSPLLWSLADYIQLLAASHALVPSQLWFVLCCHQFWCLLFFKSMGGNGSSKSLSLYYTS